MSDNKKFKDEIEQLINEGHGEALKRFVDAAGLKYLKLYNRKSIKRDIAIALVGSCAAFVARSVVGSIIDYKFPIEVESSFNDLDF